MVYWYIGILVNAVSKMVQTWDISLYMFVTLALFYGSAEATEQIPVAFHLFPKTYGVDVLV